ncbi:M23 family metallopeptidase [Sulfitobacter donghicola]|uniref:Peptidase M24 n=1 Tax=Sulfitobacter donghicola DSW-25 = KCTC 12864 = JCM 14565 TaxID=1300350 RepID=A0A073ITS4_9RHOB|nr:M23 family metallopeptidase [Sulfitobacter donghicola]KEJ88807.1 peptidase M24 [Sulfitobacter donghicola DSW-25 = KCTC 12864 = JCM 14565]KIN68601.1 Peptidase, M23/M37 family [Sulfitobacter donghicola DSW-25 = KCTC 12864 = JCM 14565]
MRYGFLALLSLAVPATAGDLSLSSPIDCDLDGPCYIQQYVDHDPSDKASDFTCSGLSYDGHKGTDFALPTYDMIETGVDVLAAAAGTVAGLRDGMKDEKFSDANAAEVEGRECGNGVVLRHADGWETQYCHLRQGSISVTKGQKLEAGDVLGQVGMSGRAEFPHLHLSVRHEGKVIDPFDPDGTITCGEVETDTLWQEKPTYQAGGIVSIGTSADIPEFSEIRANTVPPVTDDSPALVLYAFLFGTQKGDIISLSLNGPDGAVAQRDTKFKKAQAQSFRAIGKKLKTDRWPAGEYSGEAILKRGDVVIDSQKLTLTLP